MTIISLPLILLVLPACTLLAAISLPQWKSLALALGGLYLVYFTGGFPAIALLLLSLGSTWLILRMQPRNPKRLTRRIRLQLDFGIAIQILLLLIGKALLKNPLLLIPMLICAMQNIECIVMYAQRRFQMPSLDLFLCYQCNMTRLLAGPILPYDEAAAYAKNRVVTVAGIGKGASLCIRGLFQIVCLSVPMYFLHAQLLSGTIIRTTLDAVLSVPVFYFMVYYGFRGAAQLGQGIALMLGFSLPDSFDAPITAHSPQDFWRRFLVSFYAWSNRILLSHRKLDAAGYFARTAVIFVFIGILFGHGSCGLIWGVSCAGLLTAQLRYTEKTHPPIPRAAKHLLTALALICTVGIIRSSNLSEMFAFFGALLGIHGLPVSNTMRYLLQTNWLAYLACAAGLFPLHRLVSKLPNGILQHALLHRFCARAAELMMLLFVYTELLSLYLRF